MNPSTSTAVAETALDRARRAMQLLRQGETKAALAALRDPAPPLVRAAEVAPVARAARALADAAQGLPTVRVAFAGDVTLDDVVALCGWYMLGQGIQLQARVLPFGTWEQQLRDPQSELHRFAPDALWLFCDARPLAAAAALGGDPAVVLTEWHERLQSACEAWRSRSRAQLFINTLVPTPWRTLGNLEATRPDCWALALREANRALVAAPPASALPFDLEQLAAEHGLRAWHDERLYFHSKHPFALAAHGEVAHAMARQLLAWRGRSRKCVVLDLDNTLWGGIVGDDGPSGLAIGPDGGARGEAHQALQRWLLALNRRGVVLAVCSKNDETIARAAFGQAGGMVLSFENIAVFKANWRNKADNLREIAFELNLGLDAFVFIDDNPAERELVRRELPEVAVPELPEDPSEYVAALASGRWFEATTLSAEDRARARSYRDNELREQARCEASDLPTYLRSLEMVARWGAVDGATLPRAAQLVAKTNQFQLTGVRYAESELQALVADGLHWIGWFDLSDRFGEHGITSIAVLAFEGDTARIDNWVMSCRVFSRSFEAFVFNCLVSVARARGARRLIGSYRATAKNGVVAGLFEQLGGSPLEQADVPSWSFSISDDGPLAVTYVASATPEVAALRLPTYPS